MESEITEVAAPVVVPPPTSKIVFDLTVEEADALWEVAEAGMSTSRISLTPEGLNLGYVLRNAFRDAAQGQLGNSPGKGTYYTRGG